MAEIFDDTIEESSSSISDHTRSRSSSDLSTSTNACKSLLK